VFVDALDLAEIRFEGVEPAATGRPSYHPSVLLKLYIYGYLNRVQSSRRLEREGAQLIVLCSLNMKVMQHTVKNRSEHERRSDYDNQPGENCVRAGKDFAGSCL
jgi:transposase